MRETLDETDDMFLRITQGAALDETLSMARKLDWDEPDLWDLARYWRAVRRAGEGRRLDARAAFAELLTSENEYVRYYSSIYLPVFDDDADY